MKFWMLIVISVYLHIVTTTASLLPSNVQSAHAQICYDAKGLPHDVGKCKEDVVSDSSFPTCPSWNFVDPEDVCKSCTCHNDGKVTCDHIECPPHPPCKESMRLNVKDQCCTGCRCAFEGKLYKPGPMKHRCNCSCEDGGVICNQDHCPKEKLMCPDPELDEDCCIQCPKGRSCATGKKIIKYGQYVKKGNQICTCAGNPWFPNAFCAQTKVGRSLKKKYRDSVIDFSLPGIK